MYFARPNIKPGYGPANNDSIANLDKFLSCATNMHFMWLPCFKHGNFVKQDWIGLKRIRVRHIYRKQYQSQEKIYANFNIELIKQKKQIFSVQTNFLCLQEVGRFCKTDSDFTRDIR